MQPFGSNGTGDRRSHWIRENHQNRVPPRWVSFDTEARIRKEDEREYQTWGLGAAYRWREDLKLDREPESAVFGNPWELWQWVTEYARAGSRLVAVAHNLSYDLRVSNALEILPDLGWRLKWCNLSESVSTVKFASDTGTLVLVDSFTWLPIGLNGIGTSVGAEKFAMPPRNASPQSWQKYCLQDAYIVYSAIHQLNRWIKAEDLGNWQPTGAGMAYATFRHKFMSHKILVHDNMDVVADEREAMYAGRAEAWKHGYLTNGPYTEMDMQTAYCQIAKDCELPRKYRYTTGHITVAQFRMLSKSSRTLVRADIDITEPVLPVHWEGRTIWPVGRISGVWWDTEIEAALPYTRKVKIRKCHVYAKDPLLKDWATWVLDQVHGRVPGVSPLVRTYLKHSSRALIGRLSLKVPRWEYFGANPEGATGVSREIVAETGEIHRMLHVGDTTLREESAEEGRDSLPQVTGWIMAECRARLWRGMSAAGRSHVIHVDTDSVLVDRDGLAALRSAPDRVAACLWRPKGSWRTLTVHGPRSWLAGEQRRVAGVPLKAEAGPDGALHGEKWRSLARSLADGQMDTVEITAGTWHIPTTDPRRDNDPVAEHETVPRTVTMW